MSSHFDVQLSPDPGSLQRLLGVVRRRGFVITSLNVVQDESGHSYSLDLHVNGTRCPSTLRKHLANLMDVRAVSLLTRVPQSSCA